MLKEIIDNLDFRRLFTIFNHILDIFFANSLKYFKNIQRVNSA